MKKGQVDVVEAETTEMVTAREVGTAISTFVGNVRAFFSTAKELEAQAVRTLTLAQMLSAPTSAESDLVVQEVIRTATADKKATTAHWYAITSTANQFHKWTTAGRSKGVALSDAAIALAQPLHNAYVESERRRVAAEQARLQREAEEKAQADRARELRRLEEEAEAAEAEMDGLSTRELVFVGHVALKGYTPEYAATIGGYTNPAVMVKRLMASPKILKAIEAAKTTQALKARYDEAQAAPIEIEDVPVVMPDITAGNGHDRTTWSGEVLDESAFVQAVLSGAYGIPTDVLTVNQAKLTEYARALRTEMNRWPGVRAVSKTRTV